MNFIFGIEYGLEVFKQQAAAAFRREIQASKLNPSDLFPVEQKKAKPAISGLLTTHAEGRYNSLRDG